MLLPENNCFKKIHKNAVICETFFTLINTFDIPIDASDCNDNFYYSIVIPEQVLSKLRNQNNVSDRDTDVYIGECSIFDFNQYSQKTTSEAVSQIEEIISERIGLFNNDKVLAYSIFAILHEFGHVTHSRDSKLSYEDYWRSYYIDWEKNWREYQLIYKFYGTTPDTQRKINIIYGDKYRNTALEKNADDFAVEHFQACFDKIKDFNVFLIPISIDITIVIKKIRGHKTSDFSWWR